jgi:iron complex outermembrane receptor protein
MKRKQHPLLVLLWLAIFQPVFAQVDGARIDTVNMDEVVVTANRASRPIADIPGRVEKIEAKTIEALPVQNVDDILRNVANVHVNRSWGIFSQNASVTMRGLDGSSRVLVLMDGVPLNKSAGGSINWHLISTDAIDRMEVIKGPASALYGNNAMAGVISIITKEPTKKIQGEAGLFGGSYKSFGGEFNIGGNLQKEQKGFSWGINSFYRQGDGYILVPEESRDSTDVEAYLKEYNIGAKLAYRFNKNHKLEVAYQTSNDIRGQGRQVYEELGDYVSLNTHLFRANYKGSFSKTIVNISAFYQHENEFKQSESIGSRSGKYKLSDRDSYKDDIGLWASATTTLSDKNILTYGIDLKQGKADVTNTYYTSTDVLTYAGTLDFVGFFLQDEIKMLHNKMILVVGARMDFSKYDDGRLIVENPTPATGFVASFDTNFMASSWNAFSPKLALKYTFAKKQSVYISYSQGFMPPRLDDLSKSGKIRKGFKLANPDLGPEYLTNYELGFTFRVFKKLSIEPSVYYSLGKDFQYFVGTGDSIDTGGDIPKPIYQRQNIAKVEVIGGEISVNFQLLHNLLLSANYSYNHSTIKEFDKPEDYKKDLTGKYLSEVPQHMAYAGIRWDNKIVNTTLSYNYIGSQWYDDENTTLLDAYDLIDVQFSRMFGKHFYASLSIQNILNKAFIDRKGYLSPGRFITGEIKFKF